MAKRKFSALVANLRKQASEHKKIKSNSDHSLQTTGKKGKNTARPLIPFTKSDSILFIGEGNFSFAASCVEHHLEHAENVVATSLDTHASLVAKYPSAQTHVDTILDCCGVVKYAVDATNLSPALGNFDVVMFMFPHVAAGIADEARNIQTNQKMLLAFFKSVQRVLRENGTVAVTLASNKTYDLWDIKGLAKSAGLIAKTSGVFDGSLFPGYKHARTQGHVENDAGFSGGKGEERAARWNIFTRPTTDGASQTNKKARSRRQSNDEEDD